MHPELPPAVRARAATQDGLITAAQAREAGMAKAAVDLEVRRHRWVPLLRGVYLVDRDRYEDLEPRVWWRAALLAHGPAYCLVAGSAARAIGLHGPTSEEPYVEIAALSAVSRTTRLGRGLGPAVDGPSVRVRQFAVDPGEVVVVGGLPVRRADLTAIDAGLDLPRPRALSILDSALHLGLATPAGLADAAERAAHRPGIQQLRPLVGLADHRAESMVESHVRLACIDGKVPPDDLQFPVRTDDGRLIAVGDLAWKAGRRRPLIAEADGKSIHDQPEAVYRDRRRGNALVAAACDTVRFTFADALRPDYVANVIRAALAA
jgi:hypothetical protein